MSIFKCKMCGGALEISDGATVAACEYCGTQQTLTKSTDEVIQGLYNRANHLRMKSEFDKAQEVYERIIAADATDAEAYWGGVLCKYGIEYVEDPTTRKRVPTCHRTQIESVLADVDYLSATEHATVEQKVIYEAEAKQIDALQKDILKIANNEKPFDVFICYKETDEGGRRTQDSVIANDIYHQLTGEGFKVFYAAITLEDKLGQEYEPYIFAALNSAKVMLVVGSRPEYFNAVWVKNEWSRYLKIIKSDRSKLLIPCYKDMDPYDLPEEFAHLQAQDMSKIGFISDIVRGIEKVVKPKRVQPQAAVHEVGAAVPIASIAPLLKRAFMFLEDGEFDRADDFCEQVLNQDPENAEAYLGKLMVDCQSRTRADLGKGFNPLENSGNYSRVMRFADKTLAAELQGYAEAVIFNIKNRVYNEALAMMQAATDNDSFKKAADRFGTVKGFKDADQKVQECIYNGKKTIYDRACLLMKKDIEEECKLAKRLFEELGDFEDAAAMVAESEKAIKIAAKKGIYDYAVALYKSDRAGDLKAAIVEFGRASGYRDADELVEKARQRLEAIRETERKRKEERLRVIKESEAKREKAKRLKTVIAISVLSSIAAIMLIIVLLVNVIIPAIRYTGAAAAAKKGNYYDAYRTCVSLKDFGNSEERAAEYCKKLIAAQAEEIDDPSVGDIVEFGIYEQDGDEENGAEVIEWQVLEVKDGKALVISKDIIYAAAYNPGKYDSGAKPSVDWETCLVREQINHGFFNDAFMLQGDDYVDATETLDRMFLLSANEAELYFKTQNDRKAELSEAIKADMKDRNGYNGWLLRAPVNNGGYITTAAYVTNAGIAISTGGVNVNTVCGVRPAMWINLNQN